MSERLPPIASTVLRRGREQKIAALLKPGDAVLADAELGRDARLGELPRLAQLAQGHFLGDELGRPLLDPPPPLGVELRDYVIHIDGHYDSPSCAKRARCLSKRSSAFANERAIEAPGAAPRLVAGNEKYGPASGVEGKGEAPFSIRCAETRFLHVCMPRALQRVHLRPPQLAARTAAVGETSSGFRPVRPPAVCRTPAGTRLQFQPPTSCSFYVLHCIWSQVHVQYPHRD